MKITESQLDLLRSLKCERLSSNLNWRRKGNNSLKILMSSYPILGGIIILQVIPLRSHPAKLGADL